MAVLESIKAQFLAQQRLLGEAALHTLYPKDINYMFLALELVDSQGSTVDYFSWPVLPDELRETQNELTTIRKTIGGVHITKNNTFNPRQISLRGTFGRSFKVLLGSNRVEFAGFGISMQSGNFVISGPNVLDNPTPQLSSFIKNGYGCIKLVEGMKEKSKSLDQYQKPFSLYLYNPILGGNYQVEFNSFSHMQDSNSYNMLPAYTIQLTAIAPLDDVLGRRAMINSTLKNLSMANIQKSANQLAANLKNIIKTTNQRIGI